MGPWGQQLERGMADTGDMKGKNEKKNMEVYSDWGGEMEANQR